mmetsp:Transcript_94950/g.193100  ORF Transcript_94950/g.193100 Transcript_94950/m.193100 type:complete len:149 (+) Transcript_94950:1091-1537(+)
MQHLVLWQLSPLDEHCLGAACTAGVVVVAGAGVVAGVVKVSREALTQLHGVRNAIGSLKSKPGSQLFLHVAHPGSFSQHVSEGSRQHLLAEQFKPNIAQSCGGTGGAGIGASVGAGAGGSVGTGASVGGELCKNGNASLVTFAQVHGV